METMARVGSLALILISLLLLLIRALIEDPAQRNWLRALVIVCFPMVMGMVWLMNTVVPFMPPKGQDDFVYYLLSQRRLDTLAEWFDFRPFFPYVQQGGYPLILTWASQLVKNNLLGLKLVNVFSFFATLILWYDIGRLVGGKRLARTTAVLLLVIPVLYPFIFFLLKDIVVVLFQSVFINALIRAIATDWSRFTHASVMFAASLGIITLRAPLLLVFISILLLSMWLASSVHKVQIRRFQLKWMVIILLVVLIYVASRPGMFNALGMRSITYSLNPAGIRSYFTEMQQDAKDFGHRERYAFFGLPPAIAFVPLVFMGNLSGLSPNQQWNSSAGIHGIFLLPWVIVGLPLFLNGCLVVAKAFYLSRSMRGRHSELFIRSATMRTPHMQRDTHDQMITVPYLIPVLLVIVTYVLLLAALLGLDINRWRLPMMPSMLLIAALGYTQDNTYNLPLVAGAYWIGLGYLWFFRYIPGFLHASTVILVIGFVYLWLRRQLWGRHRLW